MAILVLSGAWQGANAEKMHYLVTGANGPGFSSPDEVAAILEKGILPMFDALLELEAKGIIVAGGLPVGSRTFTFILKASSNEDADRIIRSLHAWGVFEWTVVPLQSIQGRADIERGVLKGLKK